MQYDGEEYDSMRLSSNAVLVSTALLRRKANSSCNASIRVVLHVSALYRFLQRSNGFKNKTKTSLAVDRFVRTSYV